MKRDDTQKKIIWNTIMDEQCGVFNGSVSQCLMYEGCIHDGTNCVAYDASKPLPQVDDDDSRADDVVIHTPAPAPAPETTKEEAVFDEEYVATPETLRVLCVPKHLSAPLMFGKTEAECSFACDNRMSSDECRKGPGKHMCKWSSERCRPRKNMYETISVSKQPLLFAKTIRDRAECIERNPHTV